MSEVDQVTESVEAAEVQAPDVDLSAVPEKHRDYVDIDKYSSNPDYKRAIDHGYKPEKLYQEEGLDPDNFIGVKSWLRNYDKRQEEKALKSELAEIRKAQDELLKSQKQREEQAVARALAEKEEQLKIAMADGDAAKAVELSNEINQAKQSIPKPPPVLAPIFQDFLEEHPILDEKSDQFDREFTMAFWNRTTQEGEMLMKSQNRNISHLEVESILNRTMKRMTKDQQKPAPKAPQVQKPAAQTKVVDLKSKLTSEALTTYNRLLTAKGGGKEVAEKFAKDVLGV